MSKVTFTSRRVISRIVTLMRISLRRKWVTLRSVISSKIYESTQKGQGQPEGDLEDGVLKEANMTQQSSQKGERST